MNLKVMSLLVVLAVGAFGVAGCGSNSGGGSSSDTSATTNTATSNTTATTGTSTTGTGSASSGGGGGQDLKLSADPGGQLKFDKTSLDAKAGKVTITLDNPAPVQHAVGIRGNGVDQDGKTVGMGGTSTVSAKLKPGTYTFYCPVPGHEQAGMKGTLTVK